MDEKPKGIWKKSLKGPRGFLLGFIILFTAVFLVFFLLGFVSAKNNSMMQLVVFALTCAVFSVLAGVLILAFIRFIRWLFCWRNFKRFLFGLVCFATLLALFYAEEDWRGWHAWNKFKHEWEAKGEKFDFKDFVPASVPDGQNFAMAPIWVESMKAVLGPRNSSKWFGDNYAENGRTNFTDRLALDIFHQEQTAMPKIEQPKFASWHKSELTDLQSWQNYYRVSSFTNRAELKTPFFSPAKAFTNGFPASPQPQTPAQDVLLALSKYDSTIEELREASKLPYSRFPLYADADHPFDTLLPHLAEFKRCALVLGLRAIAELQNGESEKALADVKLTVELTEKIRTEPFLISHLVRAAILQITLQPIYEGLADHQWSDAQLVELDSELAKLNFLADFELTMRGERAASISTLDFLRRSPKNMVDFATDYRNHQSGFERAIADLEAQLVPSSFFYQNELTIARLHQQYFIPMADATAGTVFPAQIKDLDKKSDQDMNHHYWQYKIFAKMLMPALTASVKKFTYCQSSVNLTRTAIALERYRLAHGEFPELLDALAPQFIAQIPHDVIGGQPLHYRRTDDGQFILYSVGWNEIDDGGVVVFKKGSSPDVDTDKGDWVWRYPQK
jgi:hypothetical protein